MDATVDRLQRASASSDDVIALAGGLPDETLVPGDAIRAAFVRATASGGLQYGWPEGDAMLRGWIARRLAKRGVNVEPDDVIVTSGAQQALAIATSLLIGRHARVAVDAHGYPGALDLFRDAGATLVDPEAPGDRALTYVMPGVANPTGGGMSGDAIDRLLASDTPIVADEAYAELRFDHAMPTPLAALEPGRVWHVGSFSKSLCPGLRVGYLVPPRAAREEALRVKREADLQAGTLSQCVLARMLEDGDYDAWLDRARSRYLERCARLAEALARTLPRSFRFQMPEGGFAIWIESDDDGDEVRLLRHAMARGVSFDPGHLFAREPSRRVAMRVCFSSAPMASLTEGARRLARAIDDTVRRAA